MYTQLAHDLCAAREKAGLTQRDLSILLEIGSKDVVALETGTALPSVGQLCRLSIIYNRSFAELYQELMREAREALFRKLPDMPECAGDGTANFNRENTLARMERQLTAAINSRHAGA
jgi:transcriptional regulator with XRE-family HTH domain